MRMGRLVVVTCLVAILIPIAIAGAARDLRRSNYHNPSEVQKLLKSLNKPAVKSIQSPDGDIVDCVLIHKQPGLDHPLLKDHVIQMRPSFETEDGLSDDHEESNTAIQLWRTTNETCPEGTVPIRRTKEEDLLRAHSLEDFGKKKFSTKSSSSLIPNFNDPTSNHEYATVRVDKDSIYYGARATVSVWAPKIQENNEFSLSQMWLTAGTYEERNLNSMEVGWQIYPYLYGDNNPRIFIFWTRDAYQTTGCYNRNCPGFIQVNINTMVGASIAPLSVYGGDQYEVTFEIQKDHIGNWWVKFGNEMLGYWPHQIFTFLSSGAATTVKFGGEVVNLKTFGHTTTGMGSGHFAEEGYGKASYFRNLSVFDSNNVVGDAGTLTSTYASHPRCYTLQVKHGATAENTFFYYGGPGYNFNCP